MASPTLWRWVWINSRSWWWRGRPGVLWSRGSQRVLHDWATELNWTALYMCIIWNNFYLNQITYTLINTYVKNTKVTVSYTQWASVGLAGFNRLALRSPSDLQDPAAPSLFPGARRPAQAHAAGAAGPRLKPLCLASWSRTCLLLHCVS